MNERNPDRSINMNGGEVRNTIFNTGDGNDMTVRGGDVREVHDSPNAQVQQGDTHVRGSGSQASFAQSQQPATPSERGFWTTNRRIGAFLVGLATIVAAVVTVVAYAKS